MTARYTKGAHSTTCPMSSGINVFFSMPNTTMSRIQIENAVTTSAFTTGTWFAVSTAALTDGLE